MDNTLILITGAIIMCAIFVIGSILAYYFGWE